MKLRTSFFNATVLKKDITRFAPLWGLYTVFLMLDVLMMWSSGVEVSEIAVDAPYILASMCTINFIYAGLCALLLFGDLFSSKLCNALHAMPMRREGWFLTHLTAGLLFCLVPNALVALVSCLILQKYSYLAFLWLAVTVCQFIFFFGVGALSVQCAGNRKGAAAVYALVHYLAVLVAFLVSTFYGPILYGIQLDWDAIYRCSPAVGMNETRFVTVEYEPLSRRAEFKGLIPEDWRLLLIAAAVGLVLLGVSVLLYRRRQMESAGDFIAFKPAAPVFLAIYTLCVGAVLYLIAGTSDNVLSYLFLVIGFAIGFFTGWMLLEKKVNVFKPKKLKAFGLLVLMFFVTVALAHWDPAGITRYVPDKEQVESVKLSPGYYNDEYALVLTRQEDIEAVLQIHSDLVNNPRETYTDTCLQLQYKLRSGREVKRTYDLYYNDENLSVLRKLFSDFRYVTGYKDTDTMLENVRSVNVRSYMDEDMDVTTQDAEFVRGLLEALHADCEAGTMAQPWEYHRSDAVMDVNIELRNGEHLGIIVFADCENTIAYLKSLKTE